MGTVTLEQLAAEEAEIEAMVASVTGTIDEKTALLEAQGAFTRYARVFSAYLALAEPPRAEIEALKRATFLAWYESAEPAFCSGVSGLPAEAGRRIVDLLEPVASRLDEEFRWMLAWYFRVADFALPGLDSHPDLEALLASEDPHGWRRHRSAGERMRGRGLMGEYWLSVFGSHAA